MRSLPAGLQPGCLLFVLFLSQCRPCSHWYNHVQSSKWRQRWLTSVGRDKDCLCMCLGNQSLLNAPHRFPDFSKQASVPLWLLTVHCRLWRITCVQLKRCVSCSSCVVSVGLMALWSAVLQWCKSKLGIPNLGRFSAVVLSSHGNRCLPLW